MLLKVAERVDLGLGFQMMGREVPKGNPNGVSSTRAYQTKTWRLPKILSLWSIGCTPGLYSQVWDRDRASISSRPGRLPQRKGAAHVCGA